MMDILKKILNKKPLQTPGRPQGDAAPANPKVNFPLKGFEQERNEIPLVDPLSDQDLTELNALLDWNCFVVDAHGRRFGNVAWSGKRDRPEKTHDPRHQLLQDRIDLSGRHVLEIGCFEGIHTIGLCRLAGRVTAVDARMENVVKTIVRTAMFNYRPEVFKCDVENWQHQLGRLQADVCHHIGVLYHLKDPVTHLSDVARITREALLLDTHIAQPGQATEHYQVNGKSYLYRKHGEGKDVFSGMYDHAKWLTLPTIEAVLREGGFSSTEVLEHREERNGPRVLLFARK